MELATACLKWLAIGLAIAPMTLGCKRNSDNAAATGSAELAAPKGKQTIQNIGSDTMVNVAQAWAEEYAKVETEVSVEVSGGGSGVGIAALINGTAQIANASRKLEPEEIEKAKKSTGKDPKEFIVGFDGLAVYVHRDNPLEQLSLEELAEIYREGGTTNKWSELKVKIPGADRDDIVRVSRQNNSGTYQYFRETVVGKKRDFKAGSLDMNGSKEVVELVGKTPGAIGYSGLGYATAAVKILKISKAKGEAGITPSIATVHDKSYPLSRPLFMYTPGEPTGAAAKYMAWVMAPPGQAILEKSGYIPLPR
jgi:phosphate transport system substrate-binding protein